MSLRALPSAQRRHVLKLGLAVLLLGGLALGLTSPGFGSHSSPDVRIVGEEEIVFDWTVDRCSRNDVPDLPARAFRDADGQVQLIISHYVGRRMVGDSLDSMNHRCPVVMGSDRDPDPANFDFKEWISALYTTDGETVHALVHMEYEGDKASDWDADRDFSTVQGKDNWRYQEWNGFSYRDMHYDAQDDRWRGSRNLCTIRARELHPHGSCEPTRTWVSPVNDTVTITGNVHDFASKGGDGVVARIFKNERVLWSETVADGDTEGTDFQLDVDVVEGDTLHFRVNQRSNPRYDSTHFAPNVNVGTDPCLSGLPRECQVSAVTYARSTDGGKTYTHAPAPDHLVASVPYPYEPDSGRWGLFSPSNILHNPNDGFYYAMVKSEDRFLQKRGTCLIRTKTLGDPTSWRAWDGEGFNVRFIDPYREPEADPAEHVCQAVSRDNIVKMHESLTFNTYFDKFLLVGASQKRVGGENVLGFYYSLSDDLVHWTPRELLMEARLPWSPHERGEVLLYPSLIDPDDDSRNFEVTGRTPYLYYTRMHPDQSTLDRDLVRVQVEFQK